MTNFKDENTVKVLVHGYIADRFHSSVEPIKNAYLAKQDVNVIIVDWSGGAYRSYDESRELIEPVGTRIGEILKEFLR